MPSKSKAQHNLMAAVANNPSFAKKVGIPQSVGKDFSEADKGRKFGKGGFSFTKAKINKQNTRHGKYDLPFAALNKYAGMAEGGDVNESKAMMKKEVSFMKKKGAPKSMVKHEMAEMRGKKFAEGGDVEDLEEVTPTALKTAKGIQIDEAPETFKQMFARKRREGAKDFTWNGKKYTTELASEKPAASGSKMSSDGPSSRMALGRKTRSAPTIGEALAARFGTAGQRAKAKEEGRSGALAGRFGTQKMRDEYMRGYARGGGIESRGKTKGTMVKMASGGAVFRKAADGIASKGKTKGTMVKMAYGGKC